MPEEMIILVDPDDNKIGEIEKIRAHRYGMLHRAFSVLLFRERDNLLETLLQKRSAIKYHCGGLWTNTCCSHPRSGEDLKSAAVARLKNEMGIEVPLQEVGTFHYIAQLDRGMVENEVDHVFIGTYDENEFVVNPDEVDDFLWMNINTLQNELVNFPQKYTPWFKKALDLALVGYEKNRV